MGIGEFGQIWAVMDKGRQVWIGQSDQVGIDDTSSVCICVPAGVGVGVGQFWQIWARSGKAGHVWMGQTHWVGMDDMAIGWDWVFVPV